MSQEQRSRNQNEALIKFLAPEKLKRALEVHSLILPNAASRIDDPFPVCPTVDTISKVPVFKLLGFVPRETL